MRPGAAIRIRNCRRTDLDALEWDGEFSHDRHIIDWTFARTRERRMAMLLAEAARAVVGQVWIDFARSPEVAHLWALRVKPPWRGRGLGTRLLAAAERASVARGFPSVALEVEPENEAAQRLYVRRGYVHVRRAAPPGAALLLMHKVVGAAIRAA